jgi:NADH-quinone oxidoreductase subunit D
MPAGWLGRTSAAVRAVRSRLPQIEDLVLGNEIFRARTVGVGVLSPELVHAYGVSGPIARASGVDFDLRRDDPYLAYEELLADGTMRVLTRRTGDCYARFELLMAQAKVSLDIADACIERLVALPPGPINVRLPKILPRGRRTRGPRIPWASTATTSSRGARRRPGG